jgi:hypothetical protein
MFQAHLLPQLRLSWNINKYRPDLTEGQLAQYLRFYNICSNLIDDGEALTIKEGKKEEAGALLWKYLYQDNI